MTVYLARFLKCPECWVHVLMNYFNNVLLAVNLLIGNVKPDNVTPIFRNIIF